MTTRAPMVTFDQEVSSPDAVTPYHIDPECNFLLQVRGTKTIRTFPAWDRSVLSEEELERFYGGGSRNLHRMTPETEAKAQVFELTRGQGIHVPGTPLVGSATGRWFRSRSA